ncbi:hypothetical protein EIP91_004093 [Steccherinum ochraceum]|uniref:Uncharacterized protein n=1 Tax=Steccherinum ochraceum TaxID=92696 RepID=A0A4R0RAH4_9APHY|nr:hypothetical protein EIP91_004093 [Steccherinum ochraceum]
MNSNYTLRSGQCPHELSVVDQASLDDLLDAIANNLYVVQNLERGRSIVAIPTAVAFHTAATTSHTLVLRRRQASLPPTRAQPKCVAGIAVRGRSAYLPEREIFGREKD